MEKNLLKKLVIYKEQKPFRVLKFGKVIRVPKVSFDNWLNGRGEDI